MKQFLLLIIIAFFIPQTQAQVNPGLNDLVINVTATVSENPPAIELAWNHSTATGTGYSIHKKLLSDTRWSFVASVPISDSTYRDTNVLLTDAYEYRITKNNNLSTVSWGYTASGIKHTPELVNRGLMLVLDTSITNQVSFLVDRFKQDLINDGYFVTEIPVDRNDAVRDVKAKIVAEYNAGKPYPYTTAIMLGHVPVPYSGNLYPDAHTDHRGAWPTDLFYGDINGLWTDLFINNSSANDPRNDNVPGDGKYDNSTVPSTLELETGRIDFHSMNMFGETEVELLEKYLNKNHEFRNKRFVPRRRGLMDEGSFANSSAGEGFGQSAPRAMVPLLGRDSFFVRDYFSTLQNESYLWSYGQGAGSYTSCSGVGTTRDYDTLEVQSVFNMLFGSYFGDYDRRNNLMRAALGSGTVLTTSWSSSRPVWYYHHMAMGHPIGFSAKRSVNLEDLYFALNFGNDFPTNQGVHNVLLGDPTLRPFYVKAPSRMTSTAELDGRVRLNWAFSPDPNVLGYNLYRSRKDSMHYLKLNDSLLTNGPLFDSLPSGTYQYLLRAVALETTASGTYYNESPGVYLEVAVRNTVGRRPLLAAEMVTLYPNPTSDRIRLESGVPVSELSVLDIQGREVMPPRAYAATGLDVGSLARGMYILHIQTPRGALQKKFVKE